MKVGDLVRCPAVDGWAAAYVGLIIGVYGHKVAVLGGKREKEIWDMCDIRVLGEVE